MLFICHTINKIKAMAKNTNLTRLSLIFKFLNFNENIGNSETNNKDNTTDALAIRIGTFSILPIISFKKLGYFKVITGNEAQKIAFAGVGNPINDSLWRVSTLNFASRKPEKTGINNTVDKNKICSELRLKLKSEISETPKNKPVFIRLKAMAAGAIPKLIRSASESNSFPISEYAPNARAVIPSRKSNTAAMKIKYADHNGNPSNDKIIDKLPDNKFKEVIKLGRNLNIDLLFFINQFTI